MDDEGAKAQGAARAGPGPMRLPRIAGWFGKIPALGDFVTRRLPPSYVEAWDAWLSAELYEARGVLGEAWLSAYARAPVWRFALGAGAIDRDEWLGVLLPSFDRVGRRFPLTIAVSGGADAATSWRRWAALVQAGRRALEPSCNADGVDAALFAALEADHVDGAAPEHFERLIAPALAPVVPATSLWWPLPAIDPLGCGARAFEGLPRGADFRDLLGPDAQEAPLQPEGGAR